MAVTGSLGHLTFRCSSDKIITPEEISGSHSIRTAKHDVIGRKPIIEVLGDDLSTFDLQIVFTNSYPVNVSPQKGLQKLRKMMKNHLYKTLIIGNQYLGRYIITGIDEDYVHFAKDGTCVFARAKIKLTEYGK